jgi:hypothetical protein
MWRVQLRRLALQGQQEAREMQADGQTDKGKLDDVRK